MSRSLSRVALAGGLALSLALGHAVALQARVQAGELAKAGWTFIAFSEDTSVYMRPAEEPATPGVRKVWTAYELGAARDRSGFSFRSVKSLGEYDCGQRRTRTVGETFHAEPGLAGKTWSQEGFTATDWVEPAEGSVGGLRMEFACEPTAERKS